MRDTVLVISLAEDETARLVTRELRGRDCRVISFDIAEFPLTVTCAVAGPPWTGTVTTPGGRFELSQVRGVLYRRPTQYRLPPAMTEVNRRFAVGEARVGFGGILAGLTCRWVNHPARVADAEFKPIQLQVARSLGLTTPRTIITNSPTEARRFLAESGGAVVYKTLHGLDVERDGERQVVYTTFVTESDIDESVRLTPNVFQKWVPKAYEVRATVVAGQCFAARIDTHSDAARTDFRADYDAVTYQPVSLPSEVESRLVAYLGHFGLAFGAFDLLVTPDGEHVFAECNPNGQWGWIQEETGLPIAAAIADYLVGEE